MVYQYDRVVNQNNRKGSGGIAISIHFSVLESHKIVGIFRGCDGQMGIKLKSLFNDFTVGIFACYLPPDSYLYGQDAENFFNQASVMWEDMLDCDLLIGTGDLNARTKELIPIPIISKR